MSPHSRDDVIRAMRARHSMTTRRVDDYPVTGPWSFRDLCEHDHGWIAVDNDWLQCRLCWWCKPTYGYDLPKLEKLPAVLKGRVLPPLSGKVDINQLYANAGFTLDDDRGSVLSMVRVVVAQYSHTVTQSLEGGDVGGFVRRCCAHVRFKEHGWREAALFMETGLGKLLAVLNRAEPRKPKALWSAIQKAYESSWRKPWET